MGDSDRLKYLLDTHIWIWSLLDPKQLSKKVHKELVNPDNELWLSSISVWEFMILVERGRVVLNSEIDLWLDQAMKKAPMLEAPITHEIARNSRTVRLPHQDPADRFIAATAMTLELTLISADERMLHSRDFRVLPNK
jgi:PIN domain nuclease of toxin-antitoxin system